MMTSPNPDDISFVSAPNSPSRLSFTSMHFYSAPSSPTVSDSQPRTEVDEFQFETSNRFYVDDFEFEKIENFEYPLYVSDDQQDQQYQQKRQRQRGDSLPTAAMAFADELFCNGQVLPLKLPPRLQTTGNQSSTASSPRSPSSIIKLPFWQRSLWNDDFDPFATALENVREENRGRNQEKNHRRARSLSPLPLCHFSNVSPIRQKPMPQLGPIEPNNLLQVGPTSNEPTTPKGLVISKGLRATKLGHEKPTKRNWATKKTGSGVVQEGGGSCGREGKRQGIKGFLLRTGSMGRESTGDQSLTLWKRFSFKSKGGADCNRKKRVAIEIKTLIKYRPGLFLCLGFGFKARK